MIIIPIKWLFHWEYTLFSDKPISQMPKHVHSGAQQLYEARDATTKAIGPFHLALWSYPAQGDWTQACQKIRSLRFSKKNATTVYEFIEQVKECKIKSNRVSTLLELQLVSWRCVLMSVKERPLHMVC